jgi:hypothetical protein
MLPHPPRARIVMDRGATRKNRCSDAALRNAADKSVRVRTAIRPRNAVASPDVRQLAHQCDHSGRHGRDCRGGDGAALRRTLMGVASTTTPACDEPTQGVVRCLLGFGDLAPVGAIRFLSGTEALTGFTLITWSASFLYLEMEAFWRKRPH